MDFQEFSKKGIYEETFNLRELLEDRNEKLSFWIEYNESEIEIRVESMKIQLDEFNGRLIEQVNMVEQELEVENLKNKLLNRKNKSIRISEKFYRHMIKPTKSVFALSTSLLESKNIGAFYNHIPKYKDILEAVKNGDVDDFEHYLSNYDKDINHYFKSDGSTLLHSAAQLGHLKIVKILCWNNANVNILMQGLSITPLMRASLNGHEDVVVFLLRKGAKVQAPNTIGSSALISAISGNKLSIIKILLKSGAKLDAEIKYLGYLNTTVFHAALLHEASNEIISFMIENQEIDVNLKDSFGSTALIYATMRNNIRLVELLLLTFKAKVNEMDYYGQSALIIACKNRHLSYEKKHCISSEILKLLLENGANVNIRDKKGNTAVIYASLNAMKDAVKILLDHNADVNVQNNIGDTALMKACKYGHHDIVKMLIDKNACVDLKNTRRETALFKASRYSYHEIVRTILKKRASTQGKDICGQTIIIKSAYKGAVKVFDQLIEHEYDIHAVDCNGNTALSIASSRGHRRLVERLIKFKAEINVCDNAKQTPLHSASSSGNENLVKILLDSGADMNARDKRNSTPLMIASKKCYPEIVELLISRGAEVNLETINYSSILNEAISTNRYEAKANHTAQILIKAGANVNVKDNKYGLTPLMMASMRGFTQIVEFLLKNGADKNIVDNNGETAYQKASKLEIKQLFGK